VLRWLLPPMFLIAAAVSFRRARRLRPISKFSSVRQSSKLDERWDVGIRRKRELHLEPSLDSTARPEAWSMNVLTQMDWKRFEALRSAYGCLLPPAWLSRRDHTVRCGWRYRCEAIPRREHRSRCDRSMQSVDKPNRWRKARSGVARSDGSQQGGHRSSLNHQQLHL